MKQIIGYLLASISLLVSTTAIAETTFRPRVSLGYASYELSDPTGGFSLADSSYPRAGFGATITFDSVYLDLAYSTSMGAEFDDGFAVDDFSRTDLTLTLGIPLSDSLILFGGLKSGESVYSNLLGAGVDLTFEASGIYAGLGAASQTGNGVISFNGALALLSATVSAPGFPDDEADASVGVSLGAGYTMSMSDSALLGLKATYQKYVYTWADGSGDLDESVFSVDAELSFIF